uniref:uncharacterized protein LOC122583130 n=1 Tax=Erigeron canadensis TaxID=72917 RepID=UPI001CB8AEFE|nr:uncharacterized protein LOC122583130 [Erigeron canadensis]
MWTSTPCLNLSSDDFRNLARFMDIVLYVLLRVNNQTQVHSVHLSFSGKETSVFYKSLMNDDLLRNVQQLTFTFTSFPSKTTFPDLSHFNCKSLNHLTMAGCSNSCMISLKSSFSLPSLTTLYLDFINLYDHNIDKDTGLFCKCANLMTLTIRTCKMMGSKGFSISHPRLSNLTLVDVNSNGNVVNVDAPQLKNLTVINCIGEHLISAPSLGFLHYNAYTPSLLFTDGLPSLEKANLCIYKPFMGDAPKIVCLLRQLHTVKFLTLNLGIIELLSSYMTVKSKKPSPFTNLKSLNGLPESAFG